MSVITKITCAHDRQWATTRGPLADSDLGDGHYRSTVCAASLLHGHLVAEQLEEQSRNGVAVDRFHHVSTRVRTVPF